MDECIRFPTWKRTNRQDNSKRMMHYVKKRWWSLLLYFHEGSSFIISKRGPNRPAGQDFIEFRSLSSRQKLKSGRLPPSGMQSFWAGKRGLGEPFTWMHNSTALLSRVQGFLSRSKSIFATDPCFIEMWNADGFFQKKLGIFVMFGGCKAWSGLTMEI